MAWRSPGISTDRVRLPSYSCTAGELPPRSGASSCRRFPPLHGRHPGFRGAGASGRQRQTWSLASLAQDLAAVSARFPNARIILVADGLAGPVALAAAPLIGARLSGIIGIETFALSVSRRYLPPQLDRYLEPFRADFAGAVRGYVTGTLFRPDADPAIVRAVTEQMANSAPPRGLALLAELNRFDYAAVLTRTDSPGDRDRFGSGRRCG